MTRQQLFAAFFFAVLLFLLYQFYLILEVFLTPITWAVLLALVFYPLQAWLARRLRGREGVAAFILTTVVIALVIVPMIVIASLLVSESVAAYETVQRLVHDGTAAAWIEHTRSNVLGAVWDYLPERVRQSDLDLPDMALKATNAASGVLVERATGVIKNALLFLLNFLLTTIALFFFLRDGERMTTWVRSLIPMEQKDKAHILERLSETLTAVVQGTLVTASAQGGLAGIGYWVAGVPFAVLLGVGTALMSLIPGGGPAVWVPVVFYLAFVVSLPKAVLLFLWGVLAVSTIDNVIRPLFIGGRTQIPTIFLFFGILGGLRVYGLMGMFLAPVVIAILVAFVRIYRDQYAATYHDEDAVSSNPRRSAGQRK
jgi:predicted PurR-regulated permease PerM